MLLRQSRIYRDDLKANPTVLYIFGDNEIRVGLGGQAKEMRGEPNAVGVATLATPGIYWKPDDTVRQCAVIDADLQRVFDHVAKGGHVVYPLDGIGTGLAHLEESAPLTFAHLQKRITELAYIAND